MADFGYGGIGSGLDISGMVAKLVAADRKPADNALNLQQSKAKLQLSAVGTVKSAFDALKKSLESLKATTAFDTRMVNVVKPNSTADDVLTATVGLYDTGTVAGKAAAANGTHKIHVEALASANKWIAQTSVNKTDTFSAGTLTLTVGTGDKAKTINVQVDDGDTMTTIRNKLDAAGRKEGVQTSLLASGDQQYLSVGQEKTGTANAVKLTYNGGDTKLAGIISGMNETSKAADAKLTIDGVSIVSDTNTVVDAVPGLTLNLKKTGDSDVVISTDTAAASKVMQDFVKTYNAALAALNDATKYDSEKKEASALTGDAQMRGATSQLRNMMSGILKELGAGGLNAKTLGLDTRGYPDADGSLVLDAAKFAAAVGNQPEAVRKAFTGDDGGAGKLFAMVDGYVSTSKGKEGAFVSRTNSLNKTLTDIDKRRKDLDTRMDGVAERYKKQFLALDTLMGKLSQSSSQLQAMLSHLPG